MARSFGSKRDPENRRVHRVREAIAHVRGTFVFDVHVELANTARSLAQLRHQATLRAATHTVFGVAAVTGSRPAYDFSCSGTKTAGAKTRDTRTTPSPPAGTRSRH